jgi:beta-ribofuranosylaminobenzene 5'-phosphate synthase
MEDIIATTSLPATNIATDTYLMRTVKVKAASRLSFTLIDLNGEGGRRNGMASLSLAEPFFAAELYINNNTQIETDLNTHAYKEDIKAFIEKIQQKWHSPHVNIKITQGLPNHSGFGSKTTTLLALAKAYSSISKINVTTAELAALAGRGGTSGASVNLIDRGGYLVDGGHANPSDFNKDPKRYLVPSKFAQNFKKPPVLINLPFPDWPILIIIAEGIKLHDREELNWFNSNLPIPQAEAHRTAHHILMHLSTAIAEADYAAFCKAINNLTFDHFFKQRQIEAQSASLKQLFMLARQSSEIDAIGMSAFGPMCYAFTQQPEKALHWCEQLQKKGAIKSYWLTKAQNNPCELQYIEEK